MLARTIRVSLSRTVRRWLLNNHIFCAKGLPMVRQVLCHTYGQPNLLTTHTKASGYPGAFFVLPASDAGGRSGRRREGNAKSFCNIRQSLGLFRGFFLFCQHRIREVGEGSGRRGKKEKGSDKPVKMCFYADFLAYFHYFLYLYTQKYTVAAAAHALLCNNLPATHH